MVWLVRSNARERKFVSVSGVLGSSVERKLEVKEKRPGCFVIFWYAGCGKGFSAGRALRWEAQGEAVERRPFTDRSRW